MALIQPVRFFAPTAEANAAAALAATAAPTATATTNAVNQTTLVNFAGVLGQVLAALGPLAFDTTLTNIGTGNNNTGGVGGLTNSVFTALLFNSLGIGQQAATSPAAQQLLATQLLFNATNTADSTGLGAVGTSELTAALGQQASLAQQGTSSTLLAQLTSLNTQLNPILFSAGALAQAFQIGNGTGLPA